MDSAETGVDYSDGDGKGLIGGLREAANRLARVFHRKPGPAHMRTVSGPVALSGGAAQSSALGRVNDSFVLHRARSGRILEPPHSSASRTADSGAAAHAAHACEAMAESSGLSGWMKLDSWISSRSKPALSRISLAKGSISLHHRKLDLQKEASGRSLATMSTPHPAFHSPGGTGMDGAVDQDAPPLAQRVRNARSLKELPLHPTPPPPPPHQPTQLQPCPPLQHLPPPQRRPSIGQNGCAHECGGDAAGVEEQVRHSAPLASLVRPAPLSREGSLRASAHGLCLAAVGDSSYSGSLPAACRNAGSPAGGDAGAGSPSGGVGGEGFGVHRPRPPPLMLVPGGHFQGHPAAGGSPSGSGALPLPRLPLRSRTHGHSSVAGYVTAGAGASAGSASGADGAGLESWPEASFPSPVGVTGAYPSPKQIESPAAVPCTPRAYRPSSPGMGHSSSSSAAALAAAGSGAGPVPGGLPSPRNSTRLMRIRAQSNPGLAVLGGGSCGGSSPAGSGSGSPVVLSGSGAGAAGAAAQSPDLGLLALPPPGPPGAGPAAARSPRHSAAGYALGGLSPGGGSFRTRQHAQADSRLAQSSSWRSMQVPPPLPAAMGSLQGDAEQQEPAPAPMALPAHWRHEGAGLIGGGGSGGGGGSELGSGGGGEEAEGAAQPGNAGSTPGPLGPPPASGSGVRLAGALLGVAGEGVPVRNRGGLLPPLRGGRGNSWV